MLFVIFELKSNSAVRALSLNQPSNVNPSFSGESGFSAFSPLLTLWLSTLLPSESKSTVYTEAVALPPPEPPPPARGWWPRCPNNVPSCSCLLYENQGRPKPPVFPIALSFYLLPSGKSTAPPGNFAEKGPKYVFPISKAGASVL